MSAPLPGRTRARPRGSLVLPESIWAGLLGGLAVAAVFALRDWIVGQPLHTPTVLGTALFDGIAAARSATAATGMTIAYHVVHFAAWIAIGMGATFLVRRAEANPRLRFLPVVGLLAGLVALAVGDAFLAPTALGRTPIWIGGIVGLATTGIFLVWRHPGALPGGGRAR